MIDTSITHRVRQQYEQFPYPGYSPFSSLKWQDGYVSASWFAKNTLFQNKKIISPDNSGILILGCGYTQPYIFHKLERPETQITSIDISQSNITRAKQKFWGFQPKRSHFLRESIENFLPETQNNQFDHIDAFGVLHHLENPSQVLNNCSRILLPGGTMRVMVYNSTARRWIHIIQDIIKESRCDYKKNLTTFWQLIKILKPLTEKISKNTHIFKKHPSNHPHLVDAFFHEHEMKKDFSYWFDLFKNASLEPFALLDRSLELLDLETPIWSIPNVNILQKKAKSGEYRNHLEVYLYKKPTPMKKHFTQSAQFKSNINKKPSQFSRIFPISKGMIEHHYIWQHLKNRMPLNQSIFEDKELSLSLKKLAHLGLLHKDLISDKILSNLNQHNSNANEETQYTPTKLSPNIEESIKKWKQWMESRDINPHSEQVIRIKNLFVELSMFNLQ